MTATDNKNIAAFTKAASSQKPGLERVRHRKDTMGTQLVERKGAGATHGDGPQGPVELGMLRGQDVFGDAPFQDLAGVNEGVCVCVGGQWYSACVGQCVCVCVCVRVCVEDMSVGIGTCVVVLSRTSPADFEGTAWVTGQGTYLQMHALGRDALPNSLDGHHMLRGMSTTLIPAPLPLTSHRGSVRYLPSPRRHSI